MTLALRSQFRLVLELADETRQVRTDVIKAVLSFNVNQIASATCQLPLGRMASDGRTLALVHQEPSLFSTFTRAKLYLTASGRYSEVSEWPDQEVLIFDGYVVGVTSSLGQSATFEVWLNDRLMDLQTTSTISGAFYPSNLVDYAFTSIFEGLVTMFPGVSLVPGQYLADTISQNFWTQRDIWRDLLKPICYAIVTNNAQQLKPDLRVCLGGLENIKHQSERAKAQLERIEGEARGIDADKKGNDRALSSFNPGCVVKLAANPEIYYTISSQVVSISVSELAASTLWERLILGLLPVFELQFVPRVHSHLVVPVNPALRTYWPKKILASDYETISPSFRTPNPISRVVVTSRVGSRTGLVVDHGEPVLDGWICYAPDHAEKTDRGAIWLVDPPVWLAGLSVNDPGSTGADLSQVPVTAQTPPARATQVQQHQTPALRLESIEAFYRAYARSVYYRERFRHQSVNVMGKLRFDIAPGNIVFIEVPASRMLEPREKSSNLVGMVYGVTVAINAQTGQAGTGFSIGFVRTEKENDNIQMTSDDHPLYERPYVGAPLVEEYWFPEESD